MIFEFKSASWSIGDEPKIFGILNITPDSFSDGGEISSVEQALEKVRDMIRDGAHAIDIGGESTRPGAKPVHAQEEMNRIIPVIKSIRAHHDIIISVDTYKAQVADSALQAGAQIVNDITAGRDPEMAGVIRHHRAGWILMHMLGSPQDMQISPSYGQVVSDILTFLENKIKILTASGVALEQMALDPGIGFGKTVEHNLMLLAATAQFARQSRPVMIGTSRKTFLGKITGKDSPSMRLPGSLASILYAYQQGARFLRVHDVGETRDALLTLQKINEFSPDSV